MPGDPAATKSLPYAGVAAVAIGCGVAGVPLAPINLALAAVAVFVSAAIVENRGPITAPIAFFFGFLCAIAVAYAQHFDADLVTTVLGALAVGASAALTLDRPKARPVVALAGLVLGALLFLFF